MEMIEICLYKLSILCADFKNIVKYYLILPPYNKIWPYSIVSNCSMNLIETQVI